MRASAEHMQKIRTHILKAAEGGFREKGYDGLGVNALAQRANMTSGALYGHFSSKPEVFEEVIAKGMEDYAKAIQAFQNQYGDNWAAHFLDFYLGQTHVDDLSSSCVVPALSADVVRSSDKVKLSYTHRLEEVIALISQGLNKKSSSNALALVSLLAGSVMIARATADEELAKATLESARAVADTLVTSN